MIRSQSLQARFRSAVLISAAIMMTIVTVVAYLSAKSHYLAIGDASVRASVAAVEQTLAVGVYARDDVLLKEVVQGLVHHPSVARVAVEDVQGAPLALATDSDLAASAAIALPETAQASFESTLMSPFKADEPVGRLAVWLDIGQLAVEATRQAAIVSGVLGVLFGGVLIVFNELASRLLSRPMHALAGELAKIVPGSGKRLRLAPIHERDEVGIVTRAANRLLDLQQVALERERAMREELAALEARYRGIFDSTSAGIFILTADGSLRQANPALAQLLGMDKGAQLSMRTADFAGTAFVHPSQLTRLIDASRQSSQPEAADLELLRSDGRPLWVHCMVSLSHDAVTGDECVEGVLYNITLRKVQERAAHHRAEHDALTGLKSRAYMESAIDQQIAAAGDARALTLLFIDLDGFKAVNDRWGHVAGDAVLVEVANRLQTLFKRGSDVVGRLGGDELMVMIAGVEATHASVGDLATRLIQSFEVAFALPGGASAILGASVGVASYPMHATSTEALIHAADAAMYAVKQSGKGGYLVAKTEAASNREAIAQAM